VVETVQMRISSTPGLGAVVETPIGDGTFNGKRKEPVDTSIPSGM
jgi:hypothetical protein